MLMSYMKCIFPMNPHVRWSVGRSVIISYKKAGKIHLKLIKKYNVDCRVLLTFLHVRPSDNLSSEAPVKFMSINSFISFVRTLVRFFVQTLCGFGP